MSDMQAIPINRVLPFTVEALDLRGKAVTLTSQFNSIVQRHGYPDAVNQLLGEAAALAVVLGTTLKFDGKFILQTQSDGIVDLIVVEFRTPSSLRAYARFDEAAVAKAVADGEAAPHQLLGKGTMAMTVDQGAHMQRYQGIVALDGSTLEEIAHQYFRQSEQIPTIMRLAVGQLFEAGQEQAQWRIGGLMTQFLPQSEERMRLRDLHGGDGAQEDESDEDDAWTEAKALMETVEDAELLDPEISSERLLVRLFNQHDIRVFEPVEIADQCSCSREGIEAVIENISEQEKSDMAEDGNINVQCQFCATNYTFPVA